MNRRKQAWSGAPLSKEPSQGFSPISGTPRACVVFILSPFLNLNVRKKLASPNMVKLKLNLLRLINFLMSTCRH